MVLLSLTAGTSARTNGLIRNILPAQITVVNATVPTGNGAGLRALFTASYPLNQSTEASIAGIGGVYADTGQLSTTGYVGGDGVFLFGIDPGTYAQVTGGLNIVSGAALSLGSTNGVIIGQALADRLGVSVGSNVTLGVDATGGAAYSVVGIFSSGTTVLERSAYIALPVAQNLTGEQGKVTEIYVKVDSQNNVTQVASGITSKVAGVRVVTTSNIAEAASTLSGTLTSFFTVIGLVALLAGAFGVINTMMMSVSERTREIGTLKAIGATRWQVMKIFVSEAFLIGLIGAGVGIIVGSVVALALPSFTAAASSSRVLGSGSAALFRGALAPTLAPSTILLCLGLGVAVGVLAGLYPAWRASRMDPVEALRHV
jgi:putative ABC transport system permease protein